MIMNMIDGDDNLKRFWNDNDPMEKINVWRRVDEMAIELFHVTSSFEENILSNQIRKLAAICGSQIAESMNHQGNAEYIQSLRKSNSTMMQLRYLIYLARRLLLIDQKKYYRAIRKYEAASKAVEELIRLYQHG